MSLGGRLPISISIVIPTRNCKASVRRLLASIFAQSGESIETWVVDGSSSDGTPAVASELGAQVLTYDTKGDARGKARNLGARASSGQFLLFLDSDMELSDGVLSECLDYLEQGLDGIILPELNLGTGLIGRVRSWEREVVLKSDSLCFARLIRRDRFFSVGGFDEGILGFEDLDLQASLIEAGCRFTRATRPLLHHEETLGARQYLRKRRYYRKTSHRYKVKHPLIASEVFSPISRLRIYAAGIAGPHDVLPFCFAIALRAAEGI